MAKTKDVSVSIYMIDGKLRALAQLTLDGISISRDAITGSMNETEKSSLQNAITQALINWKLEDV